MSDPAPSSPPRTPLAGGFFIMLLVIGGALFGAFNGSTLGYALAGLALGIGIATIVWIVDRRRA